MSEKGLSRDSDKSKKYRQRSRVSIRVKQNNTKSDLFQNFKNFNS